MKEKTIKNLAHAFVCLVQGVYNQGKENGGA